LTGASPRLHKICITILCKNFYNGSFFSGTCKNVSVAERFDPYPRFPIPSNNKSHASKNSRTFAATVVHIYTVDYKIF